MTHARSNEGQFLRHIFVETGMSIEDWNNLDPRQQAWWLEATSENIKRQNQEARKAAAGMKRRR